MGFEMKRITPPPDPSSSSDGAGGNPAPAIRCRKNRASSSYSAGGESNGHQVASSVQSLVIPLLQDYWSPALRVIKYTP